MGFVAFSHAMGNWWENPCISHMMRFVNFFLWIVHKIFKYLKKGLLQGSTTARGHTFSSMQHDKLERDGDNKSYTDKCQKHIDCSYEYKVYLFMMINLLNQCKLITVKTVI